LRPHSFRVAVIYSTIEPRNCLIVLRRCLSSLAFGRRRRLRRLCFDWRKLNLCVFVCASFKETALSYRITKLHESTSQIVLPTASSKKGAGGSKKHETRNDFRLQGFSLRRQEEAKLSFQFPSLSAHFKVTLRNFCSPFLSGRVTKKEIISHYACRFQLFPNGSKRDNNNNISSISSSRRKFLAFY